MNIMKTNMLLMDNKIRKEDGDNTTVATQTPSTVRPQAGMKALMFQGMQNLMANPKLAKEVGVMNDEPAEQTAAKSAYVAPYSSNIAFQGKAKTLLIAPLFALAAAALTSCEKNETIIEPAQVTSNVEVNIDLKAISDMIGLLQSTYTQMLLQQQMNYEQYQKFMEQTTAWQNQMTALLNNKLGNIEALLADMGTQLFQIDNHVVKGFDENNAFQKAIIEQLSKYMTRDEAVSYFNQLCAEISKVVNAENATDADIQAAIANAVEKIMAELKLVNANLDEIIANQNRAYVRQEQAIELLKGIKGDTEQAKDAAILANKQLADIKSTMIDNNKQVVGAINNLDGDMKAGFATVAQALGMSTSQLIAHMNKLGIQITNTNNWNAAKIIAAINYNTHVTEKVNKTLAEFKAEFEAGLITAEQYAQAMLEGINNINTNVGTLIEDFNTYADAMQKDAKTIIGQLNVNNMTAFQTNGLIYGVLQNQQKAQAMLEIMNQNIEQIDVDMNAGIDALAAQLGCSTAQIVGTLQWLGYTEAQIANMNTAAIVTAIKKAGDKTVIELGGKLDDLKASVDKIDVDMNAGIDALSAKIGYSTSQIIAVLKWLGYTEAQIAAMNTSAIIKAINNASDKITVKLDDIKASVDKVDIDMNAGIDALAAKIGMSTAQIVGTLQWLGYTEAQIANMNAGAIINAIKKAGNNIEVKLDGIKDSVDQIDVDMKAGMDELAKKIGISTYQITSVLKWLGYTEAQIANMNTAAIINAIKTASNKSLYVIGDKLNTIINKIDESGSNLSQEEIDAIIALLQSIDGGVAENGNKLDELTDAVKALIAKVDTYAKAALTSLRNQNKTLNEIQGELKNIGFKINYLSQQLKNAEAQRKELTNEVRNFKAQINQLIAKMGRSITPQELDELLDKYSKELIAELKVNPCDHSTIESLLAEIDEKMEYQALSNQLLQKIFNKISSLDPSSADYTQQLNTIIAKLDGFKCECTCKCDYEHNQQIVHEGEIDILGARKTK